MELKYEKLQAKHIDELVRVFKTNVPDYFLENEVKPFEDYLNGPIECYEVVSDESGIIGAGGFATEKEGEARIVWYLVHREKHGKGIGRQMLERHIEIIKESKKFESISLMTSQHTDGFYKSLGFNTTREEKDYWGKGMHLVYMEMVL